MSTFNPADFGLTPSLDDGTLLKAVSAMRSVVETLKAEAPAETPTVKAAREALAQNGNSEALIADLRRSIYEECVSFPESTVALFDLLGELRDSVKVHRDIALAEKVRSLKAESGDTSEEEHSGASKSDAEGLRDFIVGVFNVRSAMGMPLPEDFPVKVSEKTGETLPDLPRIPSGPREEGTIVGRGANVRKLVVHIDGVKMDATLDIIAARILSTPYLTMSGKDLLSRIVANSGDPFDGKLHEVKLNGHDVTVQLPS